jgi:hypothetical protein
MDCLYSLFVIDRRPNYRFMPGVASERRKRGFHTWLRSRRLRCCRVQLRSCRRSRASRVRRAYQAGRHQTTRSCFDLASAMRRSQKKSDIGHRSMAHRHRSKSATMHSHGSMRSRSTRGLFAWRETARAVPRLERGEWSVLWIKCFDLSRSQSATTGLDAMGLRCLISSPGNGTLYRPWNSWGKR